MLSAFTAVFMLSHAFRTVVAVSADTLAEQFGASAQALATVAGAFHIAFAFSQPIVGVMLDRHGPRRVVIVAFLAAIAGCLISACATDLSTLIVGQYLVGFGCAPALLSAMVFISKQYPGDRFAALSGLVLSIGGFGMLLTSTPLAWVIDRWSWRAGFWLLFALSVASWVAVVLCDDGAGATDDAPRESIREMLLGLGSILLQPYTAGICGLAFTTYAAFMALRGLWLGPLLSERYGFSLLEIGNIALAVSFAGVLGPLIAGRLDPGSRFRRRLIVGCTLAYAGLFVLHAVGAGTRVDIALLVFNGLFAGYISLQYADVRSAYPSKMTGRALSVFTMAMFAGVAGVQWLSGAAATLAPRLGFEPLQAALLTVGVLLVMGALSFWLLPQPPTPHQPINH